MYNTHTHQYSLRICLLAMPCEHDQCASNAHSIRFASNAHRKRITTSFMWKRLNLLLESHKIKAIPWQHVCCIATADIIARSICLKLMAVAGFDCRAVWLDGFSTALTAFLYEKQSLYLSRSYLIFSSPIDAEELRKVCQGNIPKSTKICTNWAVRVFVHKFFAAFVITTLVFHLPLLFVVLAKLCM